MSQRLIKPGLPGSIIGYSKRGPIFLQAGGAEPEDGDPPDPQPGGEDPKEEEEEDDEEEDEEDAKEKKPVKKTGKKATKEDEDEEETVPAHKFLKLEKRMKAADVNRAKAQKELADFKANSDKVPAEVKKDLEETKARIGPLEETNKKLTLQLAVLATPLKDVTWADTDAVLSLVDLSDVDFDDNGKPDKRDLRAALRQLAKEKPYLVIKPQSGDDDDEDDEDEKPATRKRTAPAMNGTRKGKKKDVDRAALAKRFPVLGRM